MRVLFYCNYTLGIGHFFRSLHIARALSEKAQVDFVQSGVEIGRTVDSPNFRKIRLDPLTKEISHNDQLFFRSQLLEKELRFPYDFFITEMFPFGKRFLADEVLMLIRKLKAKNPKCQVIASVRDILNPSESSAGAMNYFQTHYDQLWIHSDPEWVRNKELEALGKKVFYTGYVTPLDAPPKMLEKRKNRILVTFGSGFQSHGLYLDIAKQVHEIPEFEFRFILGPKSASKTEQTLKELNNPQIQVLPFQEDLEHELVQAKLAIIRPSYNTFLHLIRTKTPALFCPFLNNDSPLSEQKLRAELLEKKGVGRIFKAGSNLKENIREALNAHFPELTIDIAGTDFLY